MDVHKTALKVAQYNDGMLKVLDPSRIVTSEKTTLNACSYLLKKDAYQNLVDFDNHLDNLTLDWMNYSLNKEIEEIL